MIYRRDLALSKIRLSASRDDRYIFKWRIIDDYPRDSNAFKERSGISSMCNRIGYDDPDISMSLLYEW